jgi:hypothetical protein
LSIPTDLQDRFSKKSHVYGLTHAVKEIGEEDEVAVVFDIPKPGSYKATVLDCGNDNLYQLDF